MKKIFICSLTITLLTMIVFLVYIFLKLIAALTSKSIALLLIGITTLCLF
jgi:hypothetical protein